VKWPRQDSLEKTKLQKMTKARVEKHIARAAHRTLVCEEHDAEHEEKDCEEGAERDEDTFAEAAPATAVELAVFGANVGLEGWGYFFRFDVVHLVFLGEVSLSIRQDVQAETAFSLLLINPMLDAEKAW
jgi:hypothetical protein